MLPSCTTTAPIGTSPSASARSASSSARRMKAVSSPAMLVSCHTPASGLPEQELERGSLVLAEQPDEQRHRVLQCRLKVPRRVEDEHAAPVQAKAVLSRRLDREGNLQ